MTNNPTIDGVSRRMLTALLCQVSEFENRALVDELRALLDAPAVERQDDFDAQRLRADTAEAAFKSLREELSQVHMQQLCDLADEWQQRLTDEKTGASGIYQQLEICQKQRDHLKRGLKAAERRIAKLEGCLRQIYSASEWTSNPFHYKAEAQKLAYAALNPNPEAESHADDL